MIAALVAIVAIVLIFGLVVLRGAPYVPTLKREIEQAFNELYPLSADDVLVDIGSGDGVVLRQAASHGTRAVGYEINPILVLISWLLALNKPLVHTELADYWYKELPGSTTVVYAFSISRDTHKLAQKMQQEATRLNKKLLLMTYGASLEDRRAIKKHRGHHLYAFSPLHKHEA